MLGKFATFFTPGSLLETREWFGVKKLKIYHRIRKLKIWKKSWRRRGSNPGPLDNRLSDQVFKMENRWSCCLFHNVSIKVSIAFQASDWLTLGNTFLWPSYVSNLTMSRSWQRELHHHSEEPVMQLYMLNLKIAEGDGGLSYLDNVKLKTNVNLWSDPLALAGNYKSTWHVDYQSLRIGHDRWNRCFCLHFTATKVTAVTFVVPYQCLGVLLG